MDEAIKILEQEVKWHQENKGVAEGMSDDWIEGFNKGCEHCLSLLVRCAEKTIAEGQFASRQKMLQMILNKLEEIRSGLIDTEKREAVEILDGEVGHENQLRDRQKNQR